MEPGITATVLVPLATTPSPFNAASKVGNVSRVPPPATELMAPARKAEPQSRK